MPKIAELPNGKLLEFPDDVPDKVMQRTVRRELGIVNQELTDAIEQLAKQIAAEKDRQIKFTERVADALEANASRLAGEVSDLIKDARKERERLGADMLRSMTSQSKLISSLYVAADSLNKTLDAAMGQSLDALDKTMQAGRDAAARNEKTLHELSSLVAQFQKTFEGMQQLAMMRRRGVRQRDGSWILEPCRAS